MSRSILIADDDPLVALLLTRTLTLHGYTVASARDGGEALERVQAGSFQLLITDLDMPRLHGSELIDQLRSTPHGDELAILVHTSSGNWKTQRLLKKLGIPMLSKTCTEEELLRNVRDLLAHASRNRQV